MEILPPISEEDKMLSGLSYPLWPVAPGFILLSTKRRDPFLHFHALQGLGYGVAVCVLTLLLGIGIWVIFQLLPSGSTFFFGFLGVAVFCGGLLAVTVLFLSSLFLGWRASAGEMLRLPVIGEWAEARVVQETGADLAHYDPYKPARRESPPVNGPVAAASEEPPAQALPQEPPRAVARGGPSGPQAPRRSEPVRPASRPADPADRRPEAGLLKQWLAEKEDDGS